MRQHLGQRNVLQGMSRWVGCGAPACTANHRAGPCRRSFRPHQSTIAACLQLGAQDRHSARQAHEDGCACAPDPRPSRPGLCSRQACTDQAAKRQCLRKPRMPPCLTSCTRVTCCGARQIWPCPGTKPRHQTPHTHDDLTSPGTKQRAPMMISGARYSSVPTKELVRAVGSARKSKVRMSVCLLMGLPCTGTGASVRAPMHHARLDMQWTHDAAGQSAPACPQMRSQTCSRGPGYWYHGVAGACGAVRDGGLKGHYG